MPLIGFSLYKVYVDVVRNIQELALLTEIWIAALFINYGTVVSEICVMLRILLQLFVEKNTQYLTTL
jgi:hypothetical protein